MGWTLKRTPGPTHGRAGGTIRLRPWVALPLGLVLILAVPPCACADDHMPELDLWPLIYYNRDRDTGEREFELLWPLLAWYDNARESLLALRPLWSRHTNKQTDTTHSYYLLPINASTSREGYSEAHFFFLYKHLSYGSGEDRRGLFALLPFLVIRDRHQGDGFMVLNLFGDMRNWLGRRRYTYFLWPLFAYEDLGEAVKYNILYPFVAWRRGMGGGGFKFWPFFGRRKDRKREMTFVMWPFFHRQKDIIRPGAVRRIGYSWPFYYSEDSPAGRVRGVLWPFFMSLYEKKGERTRWAAPAPLVVVERSKEHSSTRILPFYIRTSNPHETTVSVLWPFFWWRRQAQDDRKLSSFRFVPFFWTEREKKGEVERSAFLIWPLFRRIRRLDGSVLGHFPTFLMTSRNDWWERHFAPLFRLLEYRRDTEGGLDVRLLWRLVRWRSGPRDRFAEVAWLFSWYSGERGRPGAEKDRYRLTFLKGLFDYRLTEQERRITLLYFIPVWRSDVTDTASAGEDRE